MGASGGTCKGAVAVEARRRGKESLNAVVVEDLHTEEKTHPGVNIVASSSTDCVDEVEVTERSWPDRSWTGKKK